VDKHINVVKESPRLLVLENNKFQLDYTGIIKKKARNLEFSRPLVNNYEQKNMKRNWFSKSFYKFIRTIHTALSVSSILSNWF
jgi:hypothetical protein